MYKAAVAAVFIFVLGGCGGGGSDSSTGVTQATTVFDAARAGDFEQVKAFIDSNQWDQSERDEKGNMAIHYAAQSGNPDVIRLMVQRGASVDAPGEDHLKPLQIAERAKKAEAVAVLKELGATE